jgi:hypothetical protein
MTLTLRPAVLLAALAVVASGPAAAQTVTVDLDDARQQFDGAGVSFGLFLNNYRSASPEAQAELVRLIAEDLDLVTLQEYTNRPNGTGFYPDEDPTYFDRRADFVKAVRAVRPGVEFSVVTNSFPDQLRKDLVLTGRDGVERTYRVLDTDDPDIYDKLADWYFQVFRAYDERGVTVDVLNAVNEPDLLVCGGNVNQCRTHHYGFAGDTRRGVAEIFAQAVPAFKALLNDPAVNTTGMPIPRVMGPSTFAPGGAGSSFQGGALDYVRYFKDERPEAWDQIDIVATHQYENGVRGDLFRDLNTEAGDKPLHQSETHGSKQFLQNAGISPGLSTALSFAQQFGAAVNFGTGAWYYFQTNYPNAADADRDGFNPGGLVSLSPPQIPDPEPYTHYYAFRQLTSAQPDSSTVLGVTPFNGMQANAVAFRKAGEDTVYVSVTNTTGSARDVTVQVEEDAGTRALASYTLRVTDETRNDAVVTDGADLGGSGSVAAEIGPYSVNTFEIALGTGFVSSEVAAEPLAVRVSNVPNPFRAETEIRYRLRAPGHVRLAVFDVLGREVARLVDARQGAGAHAAPFRGADVEAGVYLYRLTVDGQTLSGRMTLVR